MCMLSPTMSFYGLPSIDSTTSPKERSRPFGRLRHHCGLCQFVDAGADEILEVRYDSTEKPALRREARWVAVEAARSKAEICAGAAGVALGPVVHIGTSIPSSSVGNGTEVLEADHRMAVSWRPGASRSAGLLYLGSHYPIGCRCLRPDRVSALPSAEPLTTRPRQVIDRVILRRFSSTPLLNIWRTGLDRLPGSAEGDISLIVVGAAVVPAVLATLWGGDRSVGMRSLLSSGFASTTLRVSSRAASSELRASTATRW
jgi:hypothetical protein